MIMKVNGTAATRSVAALAIFGDAYTCAIHTCAIQDRRARRLRSERSVNDRVFGLWKRWIEPRLPGGAASIRLVIRPDHPEVMLGLVPVEQGVDLPRQPAMFSSPTIDTWSPATWTISRPRSKRSPHPLLKS